MNRKLLIGCTAAWIIAAALLWSRQSLQPLSYYSSRSYVQRVNELIRKGALKFDCHDDRIELTPMANAAERQWFEASYLQNDVELYNRNRELFGHFFVVSDCQLREINPYLRTIRLPFAKTTEWMGNIEYSGASADAALLSSNGRTLAIETPTPPAPPHESRTLVGESEDAAGNSILLDFGGGFNTPAVEVHSVAGTAVLEQRVKRGQAAEVRLDGNSLAEGRILTLASGDWLHLASAAPDLRSETFMFTDGRRFDRLSTIRTRNSRQERTYAEDEPLLGWVGGEQNDEMSPFGEAVARSISNALLQLDESRAQKMSTAFDVQLSIDRRLQASLNEALSSYAGALVRDVSGGEPFAASITVMDGKSGQVLAASSFPAKTDLARLQGVSEEEERRLLVNHNFKRHPIGSAGKPFIYAAVTSRHPFLLDLTIPPHAPAERPDGGDGEREVLQFLLPFDYKLCTHPDARIDLQSAIERSCNKFTVELATLALAADPDVHDRAGRPLESLFRKEPAIAWPHDANGSGILIGSQSLTFPPSLSPFMKKDWTAVPSQEITTAAITPGSLERIDEAPFIEALGDITGVRYYGGLAAPQVPVEEGTTVGRSAMATMSYDLRPWRSLVERFTGGEKDERAWKVRAAFQAISPERVNLSLNEVTDFRREFVSLLLGGSTSLWTNVQLAEALSRLVTKRQIEATLIHDLRTTSAASPQQPQPSAFPELAISDESRQVVLSGMKRVVLGAQGTARTLAPRVTALQQRYPGFQVAVFSKTGSPTVIRSEAKQIGEIVAQLVTTGRLFYQGAHLAISPDRKVVVPYAKPGTAERSRYSRAVGQAVRVVARRVGRMADPHTVARIAAFTDRFERFSSQLVFVSPGAVQLTETTSLPFHVVAGQLVLNRRHPIFGATGESDSSAVYIMSIAKWRGSDAVPTPEELQAADSKVITVVFYLDIGPGSTVAVDAARTVMPHIERLLD